MRLCWRFSSEFRDFRASFGSSWEIWPFFLSFYWQFQCLSLPTLPTYSPLSLSSCDAVYEQCQSAYYGCYSLVSDLALGVRAAAHLLWWLLFCLLLGHYFCSRGAVSSSSSYCYGCCQLLLRLLGVFLLLILVHLQFPLGVWRLAALLGFPCWLLFSEWQTVREALLFLLCPDGCRRFIGVRGVGLLLPGLRVSGSRCRLLPNPFRRFSVPPLAGLEGQGCGDWVVEVLRLGYCLPFLGTPHVPLFPSQCLFPAPSPSQGAVLENFYLVLVSKAALELAPLPSPGFYRPSVRGVIDLGVMAFGHHPLPSPSLCGRVTLSVGVHSVYAPVGESGGLLASFDLREAYIPVPVHPASRPFLRFLFRDTVCQFQALCFGLSTAPQVFTWVMAPVSAILHSLGIRMRRYFDTWLVQSSSQESLLEVLLPVLQLCPVFGIVIHPRYSNLIPSQVVQYLWVVFVFTSFRASPSVERISRRHSTAAVFLSCA